MSVNPGWGGQRYIPSSTERIAHLRGMLPPEVVMEVDGGITLETIDEARDAGVDVFVAGSSVFGAADPAAAFKALAARAATLASSYVDEVRRPALLDPAEAPDRGGDRPGRDEQRDDHEAEQVQVDRLEPAPERAARGRPARRAGRRARSCRSRARPAPTGP